MVIPCLCLSRFSSCTVHHKTAVIPVDIPTHWEPRTNQSNGLRLLIFLQPLGRALKNQNAAPTTPPCFSRWLRSSSLHWGFDCLRCARHVLFESCTVHHKTAVIPVDIPSRWEPRAKQQPTGLIAYSASQSRPVRVLYRHHEKSPQTKGLAASFLVDIPRRWEPRTNKHPAGVFVTPPAAWPCCSSPVPSGSDVG